MLITLLYLIYNKGTLRCSLYCFTKASEPIKAKDWNLIR